MLSVFRASATCRRLFMGTRRTPDWQLPCEHVEPVVRTGLSKLKSRIRDKFLVLDPNSQWHDSVFEGRSNMSAAKEPPEQADIVIIGGGVMGWGVAYFLLSHFKGPPPMSVLVLEKDARIEMGATARSLGGFRQQFSRPQNVHMSLYMAQFLRDADKLLHVPGESAVDLGVRQGSYLFLADEHGASSLEREFHMQVSQGAKLDLLSPWQLSERFPWLNVDGVALGRLGLQNEGYFDSWSLQQAFRRKATSLGADFILAEFKSFRLSEEKDSTNQVSGKRVSGVRVWLPGTACEYEVKCAVAVNAAGPWGGLVGKRAGLPFSHLPVQPRKRYVYSFHSNVGPVMDCPLLVNTDGTYVRSENLTGTYVCGRSPSHEDEPPVDDLEVDDNYFMEKVWPPLGHRVPAFLDLKVKQSWAGFYDYNVVDGSPVIGYHHPLVPNLASICGFSGHGIQHSAAACRGLAEMMLSGHFTTIDLSCFAPSDNRLVEENILERQHRILDVHQPMPADGTSSLMSTRPSAKHKCASLWSGGEYNLAETGRELQGLHPQLDGGLLSPLGWLHCLTSLLSLTLWKPRPSRLLESPAMKPSLWVYKFATTDRSVFPLSCTASFLVLHPLLFPCPPPHRTSLPQYLQVQGAPGSPSTPSGETPQF